MARSENNCRVNFNVDIGVNASSFDFINSVDSLGSMCNFSKVRTSSKIMRTPSKSIFSNFKPKKRYGSLPILLLSSESSDKLVSSADPELSLPAFRL